MKHLLLVLIATLFLTSSCSTAHLLSPEDVSQKIFSEFSGIERIYSLSSTDTEYVYLVSTSNGFIILFHIKKTSPHEITIMEPLFRCICGGPKESA